MKREIFEDYINRFNARDLTGFDLYIHPELKMLNGTLEINGLQGIKDHYLRIWESFSEKLHVERFVSDDTTLAIQLWTHFTALKDDENSPIGAVKKEENFDYRGIIMYQIENGKFKDIKVAYNSFTYTNRKGKTVELGIPH
jgi:hypothetical protein